MLEHVLMAATTIKGESSLCTLKHLNIKEIVFICTSRQIRFALYGNNAKQIQMLVHKTAVFLTLWRRIFFFKFQHPLYLKCE
jgi:hypothetical protein